MNELTDNGKVKQLQALNATSKAASAFFEQASARQRHQTETLVRRAAEVCHVEYWQMKEVFQKLAEMGIGTYITGRRGFESRVRWLYGLRSIGRAARGEQQALVSLQDEDFGPEEDEGVEPTVALTVAEATHIVTEHSYKLRPNHTLQLTLPTDLSAREAERLAGWIRTLPFE
jgi:hypothetical protein